MNVDLISPPDRTNTSDRLFAIALLLFAGTIVFSIAGSLLLRLFPSLIAIFGPYYGLLVKAPTWTYMTLLPLLSILMYGPSLGPTRMALFVLWGSFIGGMSELIGTSTGLPFGPYQYTDWFGPKILGHVPYFIPLSWFAMSLISYDLAGRLGTRRYERIFVTALFMVLWDVSLDPAMSRAFPFWTYPDGGFYYGMPISNWVGWFAVSIVIAWGYDVLGGGMNETHRMAPIVYGLNCLFPLAMTLIYELYMAFFIGLAALAIPILADHAATARPASSENIPR